jgi:hypothetical protein
MSQQKKKKANSDKKDISLLTLLANESTSDSRKLLKKYKKEDAKSYLDLEQKLADLYFSAPDKIAIEKEMAKMHPHRDWIMKYEKPKEEIKAISPIVEVKVEDVKSNASGENSYICGCPNCRGMEVRSSFEGSENKKDNTILIAVLGIIGIVAILTINKK